jgi:hypothetical protein
LLNCLSGFSTLIGAILSWRCRLDGRSAQRISWCCRRWTPSRAAARVVESASSIMPNHARLAFRIDGDLHIVADHAGAAPAGRHRTAVGICQRDLLIGGGEHQLLHRRQPLYLAFQLDQSFLQMGRLRCHLQQHRGMIRRSPGRLGSHSIKPQPRYKSSLSTKAFRTGFALFASLPEGLPLPVSGPVYRTRLDSARSASHRMQLKGCGESGKVSKTVNSFVALLRVRRTFVCR